MTKEFAVKRTTTVALSQEMRFALEIMRVRYGSELFSDALTEFVREHNADIFNRATRANAAMEEAMNGVELKR